MTINFILYLFFISSLFTDNSKTQFKKDRNSVDVYNEYIKC